MPWGVAAAAIGVGGSIYAGREARKGAEEASEAIGAASSESLKRQEQAYAGAVDLLSPYARQEQAASSQLMAQMGLGGGPPQAGAVQPGGPGGQPAQMGGGWGFSDPGEIAAGVTGPEQIDPETFPRTGDATEDMIRQAYMQFGGREPTDYELNYYGEHGGATQLHRDVIAPGPREITDAWYDKSGPRKFEGAMTPVAQRQGQGTQAGVQPGAVQAGGPGGIGQVTQIPGGYGPGTGGGGAQTAGSIMGRAGVSNLPGGFSEDYFADVEAGSQPIDMGFGNDFLDPEFQSYMGLTPESLDVSGTYQSNPAYQAAVEQGVEAVNQGAAGSGSLYSGRRGEALKDVGQDVEQRYYTDAANRRESMMGARRGTYGAELSSRLAQRESDLARRGGIYESGKQREQSYYNNYMQMLQNLASPTTTTNLASLGSQIGKESGATLMGTAGRQGDLAIGGANVQAGLASDLAGGIMQMGSSWLDRPTRDAPRTGSTPGIT